MKHLEEDIQICCVEWFKLQYPNIIIHHSPNGGKRNAREAARFRKMGTCPGFPDIFIAKANNKYYGLFIEMKAESNRLTQSQTIIIDKLMRENYYCAVCYSVESFMKTVNRYFE